jgi:hypothetical protein
VETDCPTAAAAARPMPLLMNSRRGNDADVLFLDMIPSHSEPHWAAQTKASAPRDDRRHAMPGRKSHQSDSDRRPAVYKTAALPTELWWQPHLLRRHHIRPTTGQQAEEQASGFATSGWLSAAATRIDKALVQGLPSATLPVHRVISATTSAGHDPGSLSACVAEGTVGVAASIRLRTSSRIASVTKLGRLWR